MFSVPLESIAVASTSLLPFLRILGVEDRIKYYPEYATAPCVQKLVGCKGADRTMTPSWANATLYAAQAANNAGDPWLLARLTRGWVLYADHADAPDAAWDEALRWGQACRQTACGRVPGGPALSKVRSSCA